MHMIITNINKWHFSNAQCLKNEKDGFFVCMNVYSEAVNRRFPYLHASTNTDQPSIDCYICSCVCVHVSVVHFYSNAEEEMMIKRKQEKQGEKILQRPAALHSFNDVTVVKLSGLLVTSEVITEASMIASLWFIHD